MHHDGRIFPVLFFVGGLVRRCRARFRRHVFGIGIRI